MQEIFQLKHHCIHAYMEYKWNANIINSSNYLQKTLKTNYKQN